MVGPRRPISLPDIVACFERFTRRGRPRKHRIPAACRAHLAACAAGDVLHKLEPEFQPDTGGAVYAPRQAVPFGVWPAVESGNTPDAIFPGSPITALSRLEVHF